MLLFHPSLAWKIGDARSGEPIPSQTGTCNDRVGTWWKFTLVKLLVGILKDGVIGVEVFGKLDYREGRSSTYVTPLICDSSYILISKSRSK